MYTRSELSNLSSLIFSTHQKILFNEVLKKVRIVFQIFFQARDQRVDLQQFRSIGSMVARIRQRLKENFLNGGQFSCKDWNAGIEKRRINCKQQMIKKFGKYCGYQRKKKLDAEVFIEMFIRISRKSAILWISAVKPREMHQYTWVRSSLKRR